MLGPVLLSAAVCGGIPYSPEMDSRPIASLPAYPANMADDVHRPGFNGRLWLTRPIIGGVHGHWAQAHAAPGPEYYGGYAAPCATVPARVGLLTIGISPWASWDEQGHAGLEEARQFWLKEQGFTGGVRTFVNDLYLYEPAAGEPIAAMEPAAVIELAPDAPRNRSRLRVLAPAGAGGAAAILAQGGTMRISWPHNAPAGLSAGAAYIEGVSTEQPTVYTAAR